MFVCVPCNCCVRAVLGGVVQCYTMLCDEPFHAQYTIRCPVIVSCCQQHEHHNVWCQCIWPAVVVTRTPQRMVPVHLARCRCDGHSEACVGGVTAILRPV